MSTSQCFVNPPNLKSSAGAGTVEDVGGFKAYVTGPLDSKCAIVLISDIFGYEAPNLRKLAAAGFLVVVPDFLYGDPYVPDKVDWESWIKAHSMDKGYEDAKVVVATLKGKGVSAVGVAGFCWGGAVVVKLANSNDIQAAVVLHPAPLTDKDINEVKVPIAILGAEIDKVAPPEQVKHFGEILSTKSEFDSFVKIFPGVAHGWTIKYSVGDELAVKSAEEAYLDLLNWFAKYVN